MKNKEKIIEVLDKISEDAKNDAKHFDGKEFNGRNVAEYLGNLGASISALSNIIKIIVKDKP